MVLRLCSLVARYNSTGYGCHTCGALVICGRLPVFQVLALGSDQNSSRYSGCQAKPRRMDIL